MGVEYALILAGDLPVQEVAECALSDAGERPTATMSPGHFSVGLYESHGFWLSVRSSRDAYFEADDDGSVWTWEPDTYLDITFAMGKDDQYEKRTSNMLAFVARVLDCRAEDAALVLNGDLLLLTRVNGVLRKHNRETWWDHYGFVNELIAG
jgi:hypothetical protein